MADWKCNQFDLKRGRKCRRNATHVTPWGDACDKCAQLRASSVLASGNWYKELEWAVREIVRQEMKKHG